MEAKTLLILVATTAISVTQANAAFTGGYSPANWTFNANGGSGFFSNDGATLILTGNDAGGANINTDYTITAGGFGCMTFHWTFNPTDTGTYDSGGYLINGTYTALAWNSGAVSGGVIIGGPTPSEGDAGAFVLNGQTIGFRVFSADGIAGAGTLVITDFHGLYLTNCPDVVCSGAIDADDLLAVIAQWGPCGDPPFSYCREDITFNGVVDVDDLLGIIAHWGPCQYR